MWGRKRKTTSIHDVFLVILSKKNPGLTSFGLQRELAALATMIRDSTVRKRFLDNGRRDIGLKENNF